MAGFAALARGRRDEDDRAPRLLEVRDRGVGHEKRPALVDRVGAVPDVEAAFARGVLFPDAGVVDEDVQALPGGHDVAHELPGLLGPGHVAGERHRFASGRADVSHGPVGRGFVADVVDRDAGAGAREQIRHGPPDSARTSRDQGGSGREVDDVTVGHGAPYTKLDNVAFHRDRAATAIAAPSPALVPTSVRPVLTAPR